MDLNDFLKDVVEDRLFRDMTAMKSITCQSGQTAGAVGYPLLMAAFAGIELLGTLLSKSPFSKSQGASYFRDAWQHIYPTAPCRDFADLIYLLGRHGLAHLYVPKGPITVYKGKSNVHLRTTGNAIDIDANQLADDLVKGYYGTIKPILLADGNALARLNEMETTYTTETTGAFNKLGIAAMPPPMPAPTTIVNTTYAPSCSGSVF